jgi:hypothetical protein
MACLGSLPGGCGGKNGSGQVDADMLPFLEIKFEFLSLIIIIPRMHSHSFGYDLSDSRLFHQ